MHLHQLQCFFDKISNVESLSLAIFDRIASVAIEVLELIHNRQDLAIIRHQRDSSVFLADNNELLYDLENSANDFRISGVESSLIMNKVYIYIYKGTSFVSYYYLPSTSFQNKRNVRPTFDGDDELWDAVHNLLSVSRCEHVESAFHGEESVRFQLFAQTIEENREVMSVVEFVDFHFPGDHVTSALVVNSNGKVATLIELTELSRWNVSS